MCQKKAFVHISVVHFQILNRIGITNDMKYPKYAEIVDFKQYALN